jgi:hypothetical protein
MQSERCLRRRGDVVPQVDLGSSSGSHFQPRGFVQSMHLNTGRSYLQARVMRLFRLLAGDDRSAESKYLADYCQSNAASSPPSVRGDSQVPV